MVDYDPFTASIVSYELGWPSPSWFSRAKNLIHDLAPEQQRAAAETCETWIKRYFDREWERFVEDFRLDGHPGIEAPRDEPEETLREIIEAHIGLDNDPMASFENRGNTSDLEALKGCLFGCSVSLGIRGHTKFVQLIDRRYEPGDEGDSLEPWHYLASYALGILRRQWESGTPMLAETTSELADAVATAEGLQIGSTVNRHLSGEQRKRAMEQAVDTYKLNQKQRLSDSRHKANRKRKAKVQKWYLANADRFDRFSDAARAVRAELPSDAQYDDRKLREWISEAARGTQRK